MEQENIKKVTCTQSAPIVDKNPLEKSSSNKKSLDNIIRAKLDEEKPSTSQLNFFKQKKPVISYDSKSGCLPVIVGTSFQGVPSNVNTNSNLQNLQNCHPQLQMTPMPSQYGSQHHQNYRYTAPKMPNTTVFSTKSKQKFLLFVFNITYI